MGTVGNTNPWAPYNTYKDCSQGICSIYCPQYCYLIFPPPPSDDDDSSNGPFSPLIIAIISVLASALLLAIYYTLVTKFCRGRSRNTSMLPEEDDRGEGSGPDQCHMASTGLDEAIIKAIMVKRYRKGERVVEGSECAVCLCEFQESEPLRVLPKCSHAFHLPCIDTWLASHSLCPLCRANIVAIPQLPPSPPSNIDSHVDSVILAVNDQETRQNGATVTRNGDTTRESSGRGSRMVRDMEIRVEETESDQREVKLFRRSNSLDTFLLSHPNLTVSRMKIEEKQAGKESWLVDKGNSKEELTVKRSFSTGRLGFKDCKKGKKSILPY